MMTLPDEAATVALGGRWQRHASRPPRYFCTVPGAGKTTLTRGWVQGLGHEAGQESDLIPWWSPMSLPTGRSITSISIDWPDPEELEFMGIRDYFAPIPSAWGVAREGRRLAASP